VLLRPHLVQAIRPVIEDDMNRPRPAKQGRAKLDLRVLPGPQVQAERFHGYSPPTPDDSLSACASR
jgi:hypothetical protein